MIHILSSEIPPTRYQAMLMLIAFWESMQVCFLRIIILGKINNKQVIFNMQFKNQPKVLTLLLKRHSASSRVLKLDYQANRIAWIHQSIRSIGSEHYLEGIWMSGMRCLRNKKASLSRIKIKLQRRNLPWMSTW